MYLILYYQWSWILYFVRAEKASLDLLGASLVFLSKHHDNIVDVEENKDFAIVIDVRVFEDYLEAEIL